MGTADAPGLDDGFAPAAASEVAPPRADVRWQRAHEALTAAVLRLSAQRPVHEISLGELAAEAGIARSTAYEHTPSARTLLEETLLGELDSFREARLHGITSEQLTEATLAVTADVISHVERHAEVYLIGLSPTAGPGSLHEVLARQFAGSVRLLIDSGVLDPGIPTRRGEGGAITEIVVRGVAAGAVGQLAAWIALPEPRDPELFLAVNRALVPAWWLTPPPSTSPAPGRADATTLEG